jgi:23S rRNA pseudouridine2605 synthase
MEWAGLEVARSQQRTQKEQASLGKTFRPKERKPESRAKTLAAPAAKAPDRKPPARKVPAAKRRVTGENMTAPAQQKRSDRNRGRG